MALMIPESITLTASEVEQATFDLLHRSLPPECTVWHKSALELEQTQQVPFLVLGDEIGIVAVTPLDWRLSGSPGLPAGFEQQPRAPQPSAAEQSELQTAERRVNELRQLLLDSQLSELVGPAGNLRPSLHKVYVLGQYRGEDVNRLNLRNIVSGALVLARDEVSQLYNILRQHTSPGGRLTGESFNAVRLVVSPGIEVRLRRRRQTATVAEGQLEFSEEAPAPTPLMLDLQQEQVVKSFAYIPPEHQSVARDLDTRLIRGVVGSGKSLILLHRAKFLSQLTPGWKILLLTYNRSLVDFLNNRLNDLPGPSGDIEIVHFHKWCRRFLLNAGLWRNTDLPDQSRKGLIVRLRSIVKTNILGDDLDYLLEEFDWIRDQGFINWEEYAKASRRGRKRRLLQSQRREVWDLLQRFRATMRKNRQFDWAEVPLMMLEGISQGRIPNQLYHAILVDEAQDFAPSWFAVVQHMLKPTTNMLFIAADVAQKIYRRPLSWRALGIDVTGRRSRILSRSYRNTYEILRVAYELVGNDEALREELRSEGDDVIRPELDSRRMRRGPLPVILQFTDPTREIQYIAQQIKTLSASGYEWDEIAVIHRDSKFLRDLASHLWTQQVPAQVVKGINIDLASPDVKLLTLHSSKGLEFSAVFVAGVDRLQPRPGLTGEELALAVAAERRLLYVGMTRSRERLFIMHAGPLPVWVAAALAMVEHNDETNF
ncbi:MAG: 3'-5' exonuclease [Chloroflexota bacterium]|nr:3'-5' exonuclease [Chloroflexota bacterium]